MVQISEREKKDIDDYLSSLNNSDVVVLSDRFLGDVQGRYIFENKRIHEKRVIEAKGCYLGAEACAALAATLKRLGCQTERLHLEWNSVGTFEHALVELSASLSEVSSLTFLDLRNNNISAKGAQHLARGLETNESVETVDLRWNEIGDIGALAFLKLIESNTNTTIRKLDFSGNNVSETLIDKIEHNLTVAPDERVFEVAGTKASEYVSHISSLNEK